MPMARRSKALLAARETFKRLSALHSDAHCELDHRNPFELLVATDLSAQTTDVLVNRITPDLFRAYPDAQTLAQANPDDVEQNLNRMRMIRQNPKNILEVA